MFSSFSTDTYRPLNQTPLMFAVLQNSLDEMSKIINETPNTINDQDTYGMTALMLASKNSRTVSSNEAVEILIKAGCDLNIQNINGFTALMLSVIYQMTTSSEKTVEILINAKCKLNLVSGTGKTALFYAIENSFNGSGSNTIKMLNDALHETPTAKKKFTIKKIIDKTKKLKKSMY